VMELKDKRRPSTLFFPKPVALVTAAAGGRDNVMTAAWVNVACMDPPMLCVSVRSSRFTHGLIQQSGQFVVNMPGEELLEAVELCGNVSGRDGDKFQLAGLTRQKALKVEAPLVAECPLSIECEVRHSLELGSHTLFIGEVMVVWLDDRHTDEAGHPLVERMRPFVLNYREYWGMGERLGTFGSGAPPFRVIP